MPIAGSEIAPPCTKKIESRDQHFKTDCPLVTNVYSERMIKL